MHLHFWVAASVAFAPAVTEGPRPPLPPADGHAPVTLPPAAIMRRQILARDQALFDLQFGFACDVKAMRDFVTDDMEFYHDHEGFAVKGGDQWASDFGRFCKDRVRDNYHQRRRLVASSVVFSPLPNFGAVETGEQQFYWRKPNGQWKLNGRSRFAIVWRLGSDGVWRIARDLSYDHREL